jgi:ribosomal protein L11 methyltransferase
LQLKFVPQPTPMQFTEVTFHHLTPELSDVLIAFLADAGFEGFEENENQLRAFIPSDDPNMSHVQRIADLYGLTFTTATIPAKNWNAEWEANFPPVLVDDFCIIRAPFHVSAANVAHEIVITPKMSFGTGHHATTYMMISQMRNIDFVNRAVLDFGTGTGVLAILASKLGASRVTAIDNDAWSIKNAQENFGANGISNINLVHADKPSGAGSFDVILANITRNVITANFPLITDQLRSPGVLLLSGLIEDDEQAISQVASQHFLELNSVLRKEKWICLEFRKRQENFTDNK